MNSSAPPTRQQIAAVQAVIPCRLSAPDREFSGINTWLEFSPFQNVPPGYRPVLSYVSYFSPIGTANHDVEIALQPEASRTGTNGIILLDDNLAQWTHTNWGQGWPVPSVGGRPWGLFIQATPPGGVRSYLTVGVQYEPVRVAPGERW